MATSRRSLLFSAQQLDPLSWFTGPLVPIVFAGLAFAYGAILTVVTWTAGGQPWLQPPAVLLTVGSGLAVHVATRPLRPQLGWRGAALALLPSVAAVAVSALGYAGSAAPLDIWWAPGALALAIASLAPYLPLRELALLGSAATVVAVSAALLILQPTAGMWGPVGAAVIIAYQPLIGVAATLAFSYSVVSTMLPMTQNPSWTSPAGQDLRDDGARSVERVMIARLTARAAPFLEGIADAGRITPADRALAGQLARRMRDDLVTQSNLSWLDSVAGESRLVVVDPERRAQRMNNAQRTALRAMIQAIVDTPGIDSGSLMVELREAPHGATAVGVSLDMALPEGTRIMHLAPYYLTLKVAVDGLAIDQNRLLRLTFRVGGDEPSSS